MTDSSHPGRRGGALALALLLPLAVGGVGGLATAGSVGDWYPTLAKPAWNPPAAVFGPVWTILYLTMGLASWLVWRTVHDGRQAALGWYLGQLLVNLIWSPVFFGLRSPGGGLVVILVLLPAVAVTAWRFGRVAPTAGWLLVPYLAWVGFATVLNAAIVTLNR